MKKIQISPSILSANFSQLGLEIKKLEEGGADMIHVDVMDGHFVPNLTIGPPVIKTLRNFTKLPFDVHLMISPVHKYIKDYADAGADIITIHPEATDDLAGSIKHIKDLGKKAGVSLNPNTNISVIKNHLDKINLILLMSVYPGLGGQSFIENSLDKISRMQKLILETGSNTEIEVDGGIKADTVARVVSAGANVLVAGSAVFNDNVTVAESIRDIRSRF